MKKKSVVKAFAVVSIRIVMYSVVALAILVVMLAFTSLPYWARYRLGTSLAGVPENTQTILVMGAGGFPSEQVLMRLWYTAELATRFNGAKVVIATPGDTCNASSTVMKMRSTLVAWGIDSIRIILESKGLNTRHQAMEAYSLLEQKLFSEPVVIVSSPEHIYRSVKCFEKAGFNQVSGKPTLEAMLETDLRIEKNTLGGEKKVPEVGKSITVRYKFWDYLKYEVEVAREYLAIIYYRLKGWI
jgi:uncharacterized SAM-binding protein YcdF (DUF218 family)